MQWHRAFPGVTYERAPLESRRASYFVYSPYRINITITYHFIARRDMTSRYKTVSLLGLRIMYKINGELRINEPHASPT